MKIAKKWAVVMLFVLLMQPGRVLAANDVTVSVERVDEEQTESTEQGPAEDTTGAVSATKGKITTDDFEIHIVCGLEGNYRSGAALPVAIYIESKNEDFEGVARIIVPGNMEMGYPPAAYEKDVLLSKGTQKVVSMSVYDDSDSTLLYFQLDDEKGRRVIDQKILMTSRQNSNALAGVLCDDYTALNYFDKTSLSLSSGYEGETQLVELDETILPDQASGLDALSYLIVNSYDTSRLSGEQVKAVESWVKQGGVLVVGAGADYQQTLSAFDGFISVKSNGMASGSMKLSNQKNKEAAFTEKDGILDFSLEGGTKLSGVLEQDGLIRQLQYGSGVVVVTAMNLGMEPVTGWGAKQDFARMLLVRAAETGSCAERISELNYGYGRDMWSLTEALDSLIETRLPNLFVIGVILLLFVLAGPIIYFILKAVDRRGFLWILIPAVAVFFTVVIFVATMNLRIHDPQSASVTVLYDDVVSGEGMRQEVSMSILVPTAKKIRVGLSDTLSSLRLFSNWDEYYSVGDSNSVRLDYKAAIRESGQGYQLAIENKKTFESVYVGMESRTETKMGEGLATNLKRTITGVSGSITNNTGQDMEGVGVYVPSFMVSIGKLKAGETKEFSEKDNELFYGEDFEASVPGMDEKDSRYYQLSSIYQMIFQSYMGSTLGGEDTGDAYVVGYLDTWDADYVKDENVKEFNKAVFVRHEELGLADYQNAKMMSLFDYATVSEDWDPYDGMLYANSAEEIFDLKGVVGDIYAFVRASGSVYGSTDNVKIYAWNLETGMYDEILSDAKIAEFDGNCPYLDKDKKIKMKFTGQSTYTDYVPSISVVGTIPEVGGEE